MRALRFSAGLSSQPAPAAHQDSRLAPLLGAGLEVMERDARKMRGTRPFLFTNLKENRGAVGIAWFIANVGGLVSHRV